MSTVSKKDPSLIFGVVGAICLFVAVGLILLFHNPVDPSRHFAGYLLGVSFWISILVGMLFINMIFWLFDAGWAVIVRRQLEHAMSGFFWLGLVMSPLILFVVFAADSDKIAWAWTYAENLAPAGHGTVGEDVLWVKKAAYLNSAFFVLRFVLIFVVWAGLAYFFRKWSFRMDETGDHKYIHWSRRLAALGIFACAIFTSIAAIDWFKTLNYHWFSTMYGVWFFSASMRAALSATVLILFWQAGRKEGLMGVLKPVHTYLLGCLMLAFTVFWAYISFSQFFLIYSANIPEETFWYNMRELTSDGSKSGWYIISRLLILPPFLRPLPLPSLVQEQVYVASEDGRDLDSCFPLRRSDLEHFAAETGGSHAHEPGWLHYPSAQWGRDPCGSPRPGRGGLRLRLGLPPLGSSLPFHSHSRSRVSTNRCTTMDNEPVTSPLPPEPSDRRVLSRRSAWVGVIFVFVFIVLVTYIPNRSKSLDAANVEARMADQATG
jgi:MFS family permease